MMSKIQTLNYRNDVRSDREVYHKWLDEIMKDDSLRNIALLGIRGAGKSSVIHSYDKHKHDDHEEHYLYISLAEFESCHARACLEKDEKAEADAEEQSAETDGAPDGTDSITWHKMPNVGKLSEKDQEQLQKRLEYNLLCQILARCTKEDLRWSKLKPIPEMQAARRLGWMKYLHLFVTGLLLVGLIYEERFGLLLRIANMPDFQRVHWHAVGYILAFVLVFAGACYLCRKKPGAFQLGKINIKAPGADAEVVPSEDEYCLDRYKFELVHILSQIADKIDCVVVIEDMELIEERCCMQIMSRLREINNLVNTHRRELYRRKRDRKLSWWIKQWRKQNCEKKPEPEKEQTKPEEQEKQGRRIRWIFKWKRWNEPIRFIYAMSEGTFDAQERTRMFDTIVPILPALNAQNAYAAHKDRYTGTDMHTKEMDDMMKRMARAVTDARIQNDIGNEYLFFCDLYEHNNRPQNKENNEQEKRDKAGESADKGDTVKPAEPAPHAAASSGHAPEIVKQKDPEKKPEISVHIRRQLLALAAYKVLFPWEFHYAFTQEGRGVLLNPKRERFEGRTYDDEAVEFVSYLITMGYLKEESLTLIGYSPEELRRHWISILTTGSHEERMELLMRFEDSNIEREREPFVFKNAAKVSRSEVLRDEMDAEVIHLLSRHIWDDAQSALRGYYAHICDQNLPPWALVNLLHSLATFKDKLPDALAEVNLVPKENTTGIQAGNREEKEVYDREKFRQALLRRLRGRKLLELKASNAEFRKILMGNESECIEVMCILLECTPDDIRQLINKAKPIKRPDKKVGPANPPVQNDEVERDTDRPVEDDEEGTVVW